MIIRLLKNQYFYLLVIIFLAFVLRLYKIDAPIADWHSWRQADTAAVTRNFIKEGFNPFVPKYDDMSSVSEKPYPNPNGFRFVEFPIYNIAVYPLYLFFGINDYYSRLVSVLFSLGSIVFLYLICKTYFGIFVSLITSLVYALLPFNVFFSRTTLPEPTFLFFSLGMVYFVNKFISTKKGMVGAWGFLFTAIAFLIKPWAIFFIPPLIYSIISKYKRIPKKFIFLGILALLPFILWRFWITQQPEGIPASSWLMNADGIRFRPAFWWWIVQERLGGEILGVTGLVLFVLGLIVKPKNGNYFFHIWALSMFLYFVIFATGNVRHNYYQYIFVPIGAVFLTQGFLFLIKGAERLLPRFWTIILALIFLPLSFYFTWMSVRELYKINNPVIISAGKMVDAILPKEAIVIAPYNGDTAFLYQTNRKGWAFLPIPLTDLIADYGVTHLVSTIKDERTKWALRHFKVLENNSDFIIVDLREIESPITSEDPEL